MTGAALDPVVLAVFLVAAVVPAGFAQSLWLASPAARAFAWPLDAGLTLRGRRLFGVNKTIKGFVVMVPATALSFGALAAALGLSSERSLGLWAVGPVAYVGLGLLAGLGFMAGELPNSFIKRQLGVAPGQAAEGVGAGWLFALLDRVDSVIGLLLALSLAVPVPGATWIYLLLIGPVLHAMFSLLVFRLGGKARAA